MKSDDLISRSALLEKAYASGMWNRETQKFDLNVVDADDVVTAPAVDAVEVVRCKNCKHYEDGVCGHIAYIMDGYYRNTYEVKSPDDFCSIGERLDAEVER